MQMRYAILQKCSNFISKMTDCFPISMKETPCYVKFYNGSWSSELLFKARSQSLEVNERTYRWNAERSKECKGCRCHADESVYHIIVECERYERERNVLIQSVSEEWGREFFIDWNGNENLKICQLLGIGDLPNERVIEAVKIFLVDVWKKRSLLNPMNLNVTEAPLDHQYVQSGRR